MIIGFDNFSLNHGIFLLMKLRHSITPNQPKPREGMPFHSPLLGVVDHESNIPLSYGLVFKPSSGMNNKIAPNNR